MILPHHPVREALLLNQALEGPIINIELACHGCSKVHPVPEPDKSPKKHLQPLVRSNLPEKEQSQLRPVPRPVRSLTAVLESVEEAVGRMEYLLNDGAGLELFHLNRQSSRVNKKPIGSPKRPRDLLFDEP